MKRDHYHGTRRFERISHLSDFKVDKHQVDPRGWSVVSPGGSVVGEVKDLLVDTQRMTVRYLEVELDRNLARHLDSPRVLVPVERAQRQPDGRRLLVDGLAPDRLADLSSAWERRSMEFWEEWWNAPTARPSVTDLNREAGEVRPVIERRRIHPDERAVAHERSEPPAPQQPVRDL